MFPGEDLFISDEEVEYCPLCVEEMDISDKNFKPCPCGYQICQFCYNNIRQNPELNGRCPGCRRLYDDESVEYKTLTAEEYKSQQVKKERREREKKQKEKEKKELEIASKKHLAGLRVVQKNLVYVTGLNPPCPSEDLHSILRSDKYFGQYGKILKIVVNRKSPSGHATLSSNLSIVVYVTFTKKDDALRCINELDGSLCDGRVLRAAHGTTKYCLSYLRGHPCPNPNCMFLHEPGEEADSYTRKDLSTHQGIKMGMSGLRSGSITNLQSFHFSEDDNQLDDERGYTSTSHAVASNATPVASNAAPILPATAHWAKTLASDSASASPSVTNGVLANAAAFPSLGEIFKEQKTQKKDPKKSKSKSNKDGTSLPDDVDLEDVSVLNFVDDCSERLRALSDSNQKLKVHFDNLTDASNIAPFFHYDEKLSKPQSSSLAEEKALAIHVIEKYLLRPMKKYHLAYLNQPQNLHLQFLAQQAHIQQQQQVQSHTQVQPGKGSNQSLSRVPLTEERGALIQEGTSTSQQQQMLMMQLQQQTLKGAKTPQQAPRHLNAQVNQAPQLASQLNALRMSERSKTSTPPPPGLFAKNQDSIIHHHSQGPPSSSSQLLTQLMSGKK
ncbi:hypothetical protein METBIDRAFT_108669 [Metschnikowia bicuspidata var. bicuspidata NRRL YB-4993]|uniref:General negative regulator of transcription subunit 4 n=1 Tax=Metschnikowia bicuspidata var. bicuspidata NRRL YB-4993 TaxID=869754 RepID=A0A1A0HHD7_9ASCO|nr:hypothetical protein METBIDRAFT_108669 [Metschnikowia bicuspidata var. bicuspidata NRRL YB-4993]OBA23594.1 hypothetical protein METBIDRAFT_108669 [Metschnikowia bicuspidata var. bicuspidata NRRL YB-4993]